MSRITPERGRPTVAAGTIGPIPVAAAVVGWVEVPGEVP